MARLPQPGSDNGNWGHVLNDFLAQTHNSDGTLKNVGVIAGKADNNNVVHTNGDETINGIKTFTASPIVPSPTSNTQVANKQYVDSNSGAEAPLVLTAPAATDVPLTLVGATGQTAPLLKVTEGRMVWGAATPSSPFVDDFVQIGKPPEWYAGLGSYANGHNDGSLSVWRGVKNTGTGSPAIKGYIYSQATAANSHGINGVEGIAVYDSAFPLTNDYVTGGYFLGTTWNTGSVQGLYGVRAQADTFNANVDVMAGLETSVAIYGSGNIGTAYGINIGANYIGSQAAGIIGSAYGLYIGSQKVPSVTNAWGIYQAGANDINHFAGKAEFVEDIECVTASKGVILKSPGGNRFRVTVDDSGSLTAVPA